MNYINIQIIIKFIVNKIILLFTNYNIFISLIIFVNFNNFYYHIILLFISLWNIIQFIKLNIIENLWIIYNNKIQNINILTTGKVEVTPTCDWEFCEAVGILHSHLDTCSESSTVCTFETASSTPFTMFESSVFTDLSAVHFNNKGLNLNVHKYNRHIFNIY